MGLGAVGEQLGRSLWGLWSHPQQNTWRQRVDKIQQFMQCNGDILAFQVVGGVGWCLNSTPYFHGGLAGLSVAFYLYMGLSQKQYQEILLDRWQIVALAIVECLCLLVMGGVVWLPVYAPAALWAARVGGFTVVIGNNLIRYR